MDFTLQEFIKSPTADKWNIDNTPSKEVVENINYVISRLQPIRDEYGKPIYITSGYRCPELNKKVGGKKNSQHLMGLAADLKWDDDLFTLIAENYAFDQLIEEKSGSTKWIHISFKRENERHQILEICK